MLKKLLSFLFALSAIHCTAQFPSQLAEPENMTKWVDKCFFKSPLPPFSFKLDNVESASFIKQWKRSAVTLSVDKEKQIKRFTYTDPASGLSAVCDVTVYSKFPAVEWVLSFVNNSDLHSATISDVHVSDIIWETSGTEANLHTLCGSYGNIADFKCRLANIESDSVYSFSSRGGFSSSADGFPYFNLWSNGKRCKNGIICAIGWSGNWLCDFSKTDKGDISHRTGLKTLSAYLLPHEKIRGPMVSILFWSEDNRIEGNNSFRRFMLAHHTPKKDGKNIHAPYSSAFHKGGPAPCLLYNCLTEGLAIEDIKRHEMMGLVPETMWLDAAWSARPMQHWYYCVGSWRADSLRFPLGLNPIAKQVHRAGAKFLVWFEPERVVSGTYIAQNHPEWLIRIEGKRNMLFDLGNPQACEWMCKHIGDIIEEYDIDIYRQDFNFEPADYWLAKDTEGRKGISEIRHVEGLYRFFDYLLERFPNLVIDNCASGGRRLDLEIMNRSIPLWRSDYNTGSVNSNHGIQNHTYNLSQYLPISGTNVTDASAYHMRSHYAPALRGEWNIFGSDNSLKNIKEAISEYMTVRDYFLDDFYPLTGDDDYTTNDKFMAYQLHRQSDNSGIVLIFKQDNAKEDTLDLQLSALNPDTAYEIRTLERNEKGSCKISLSNGLNISSNPETAYGAQLSSIRAALPQSASVILHYTPKTDISTDTHSHN